MTGGALWYKHTIKANNSLSKGCANVFERTSAAQKCCSKRVAGRDTNRISPDGKFSAHGIMGKLCIWEPI